MTPCQAEIAKSFMRCDFRKLVDTFLVLIIRKVVHPHCHLKNQSIINQFRHFRKVKLLNLRKKGYFQYGQWTIPTHSTLILPQPSCPNFSGLIDLIISFQLDKLRVENEQLRRAIEENGMTISREPDPSDLGKCDD